MKIIFPENPMIPPASLDLRLDDELAIVLGPEFSRYEVSLLRVKGDRALFHQ